MKKITVIEVQAVVAVPDVADVAEVNAEVTKKAYAFKKELGDTVQFNVLTREVPVQEAPDGQ